MGDPVESLRAIRKRRPWAGSATCPECHHASHAGHYCFVVPVRGMGRGHYCGCDQRNKEAPDGPDSPASGDSRGAAVRVGDVQGRAPVTTPRQELAKLGGELADGAEDILARIGEIGQTMTDAAERWRGATK